MTRALPPGGLKRSVRLWTGDDLARLRADARDGVAAEVTAAALGRSVHAVQLKARRLARGTPGFGLWTKAEIARLRADLVAGVPADETAAALGRSRGAVVVMSRRLGLGRAVGQRRGPRGWTPLEDAALLAGVADRRRLADIAAELGRGLAATCQRYSRLRKRDGLARGQRPRAVYGKGHWSADDDAALRADRAAGVACAVTAARIGRTEGAVWHRLSVLARADGLPPRPFGVARGRAVPAVAVPVAPVPVPVAEAAPVGVPAVAAPALPVARAVEVLPGWAAGFGGVQRDYARWLAGLPAAPGWTAGMDHALAHDVFAGLGVGDAGAEGVARFRVLTAALRDADGLLPVTASAVAVPVLRARSLAAMEMAA